MKKSTIEDVAKRAGVSTFTVSRALRGLDRVSAQTRAKVEKAAAELEYTASKSASALASGRTNRIALLVRERISGWFVGELLEGLSDVVGPEGYDLVLYRASNDTERADFFKRKPANRNADALILTGFGLSEKEKEALPKLDIPIVSINAVHPDFTMASVAIDDDKGEASAVSYLAALGHRDFCFVGRDEPLSIHEWGPDRRITGYRHAISALKLNDCGVFHFAISDPASVGAATAKILALPHPPTAICAWSDDYALRILHELRRVGLSCPRDVSVIGFDGQDIADYAGLSTISQPARELGRIAARKALDLLAGAKLDEPRTTVPTTITPRETTGSPRTGTPSLA